MGARVPLRRHPEDVAARNRRLSLLLVVIAGVLAALLGWTFGELSGLGPLGPVLALGLGSGSVATSWYASDRIVIAATGARPADPGEHRRYHNLVEGLAIAAGLPKPRLYLVESAAPNAYATGRDPDHAAIAVTTGLLEKLNRQELEGVLAHELAHVRNLDVRLLAVTTVVVGGIVLLAEWTLRAFAHGGWVRDRRRTDGALPVLAVLGVLVAVVAPLVARLLKLAVSRQREYLADIEGVLLTRYPTGLADALRKIADDGTPLRRATAATAHLWIHAPYAVPVARASRRSVLFETHPPIEDRIARLERL